MVQRPDLAWIRDPNRGSRSKFYNYESTTTSSQLQPEKMPSMDDTIESPSGASLQDVPHGLQGEKKYSSSPREKIRTLKTITHPREWDSVEKNLLSTLYISNSIINDQLEKDHPQYKFASMRRNHVLPRKRVKRDGRWIWIYERRTPETDEDSLTRAKKKIVDEGKAPKPGGKSRRGRTPQGRTYRIRREIFRVFMEKGESDQENQAVMLLSTSKLYKHPRGDLTRVSIRMPNFSLAICDLMIEEILPAIINEKLERNVMNHIMPKRGPGSKNARLGIDKIIEDLSVQLQISKNISIDKLLSNKRSGIQNIINKIWRSVLTRLVELNFLSRLVHEDEMKLTTQQFKINDEDNYEVLIKCDGCGSEVPKKQTKTEKVDVSDEGGNKYYYCINCHCQSSLK